jgi:hypothetical protein
MSLLSAKHLRICRCSWILAGGPWSTELADPLRDDIFPAALKEGTMAEAKLAPNLPDWMVEHASRYLSSGGTDGHMYKTTVPGLGEITAPALLLNSARLSVPKTRRCQRPAGLYFQPRIAAPGCCKQ